MTGIHPQGAQLARTLLWVRLVLLVLVIAGLGITTVVWGTETLSSAIDALADQGWSGVVLFMALYAVATVLLVPGTASTLTAGLVYGTIGGALVSVGGATIGAVIAYAIARGVGRGPVQVLAGDRVQQIEQWLETRQFRSILVLRLLPIVPFNLFNYAAGLSPIRPRPYTSGTALGIAPGALLFAALGSAARSPTSGTFLILTAVTVALLAASGVAARRMSPSRTGDRAPARR